MQSKKTVQAVSIYMYSVHTYIVYKLYMNYMNMYVYIIHGHVCIYIHVQHVMCTVHVCALVFLKLYHT